jgi:hypothetical protein
MKTTIHFAAAILILGLISTSCRKSGTADYTSGSTAIEVITNDIPYATDDYLRISFTLKTFEWKKLGLSLRQINVLDDVSKDVLVTLNKGSFPKIHSNPLPSSAIFHQDQIYNYYLSIQLPVDLEQTPPARVSIRLVFRDTVQNRDVIVSGGIFTPRYKELPRVIASPVKGTNWMFFNQSTNDYHFYTMMFMNGKRGTGERFAFDNMQVDASYGHFYQGDPGQNSSYFCYRDTLFAVADGTVVAISDTMTENDGNLHNHLDFKQPIDYAGNYMIIDIGQGQYAMYAHCVPHSIWVKPGDKVTEGQPLALLGNAGNSDAPHLHFQITDGPDFFMSNGVPFVLKKYTLIGQWQNPYPMEPEVFINRMNEQKHVISFE